MHCKRHLPHKGTQTSSAAVFEVYSQDWRKSSLSAQVCVSSPDVISKHKKDKSEYQ